MKDKLQIYLGGKMTGLSFNEMYSWRTNMKEGLEDISGHTNTTVQVVNPVDYYNFIEKRHQSELEIMNFDLAKVKESDLFVVKLEGLKTSIGTIIECYEAYKNNIPVLAFGRDIEYETLHPWIKCCITRHDKDIQECVKYIKDFYMR